MISKSSKGIGCRQKVQRQLEERLTTERERIRQEQRQNRDKEADSQPLQQAVNETKKGDDRNGPEIASGDRHQGTIDVHP